MKRALIIGHSGQDGGYLLKQLAARGYVVAGATHREVIGPLRNCGAFDVNNIHQVRGLLREFRPDEIYYLAAFHHSSEDVPDSEYDLVQRSLAVNTLGFHNVLSATADESFRSRIFYAASSHVFGSTNSDFQNEETPFNPVCAYGISKAAGVQICRYYRQKCGLFASAGILYNHESPRRSGQFVFSKVIKAAAAARRKQLDKLFLGSLDSCVDWGYAPDYVDAMWRILQLDVPDDFVVASGELHSVRELVEIAFEAVGLDWQLYVAVDAAIVRKGRSGCLRGDGSKLRLLTGWYPTMSFRKMVENAVRIEIENEH